jgi:hypothetical protein
MSPARSERPLSHHSQRHARHVQHWRTYRRAACQPATSPEATSSAPPRLTIPLTVSDFACAALHGAAVLDAEVDKINQGSSTDQLVLLEVMLYALRSLRCAIGLSAGAAASADEASSRIRRLVAFAEAKLEGNGADLTPGAALIMADGPHGAQVRSLLTRLCCDTTERWLPAPPRPARARTQPALEWASAAAGDDEQRMRACVVRPSVAGGRVAIPVIGFGTGIFYSDADTVRKAISHAASRLGYSHFDCAEGCARAPLFAPHQPQ